MMSLAGTKMLRRMNGLTREGKIRNSYKRINIDEVLIIIKKKQNKLKLLEHRIKERRGKQKKKEDVIVIRSELA